MALTIADIENYVKGDGLECPYCGCNDLSVGRIGEPSDGAGWKIEDEEEESDESDA